MALPPARRSLLLVLKQQEARMGDLIRIDSAMLAREREERERMAKYLRALPNQADNCELLAVSLLETYSHSCRRQSTTWMASTTFDRLQQRTWGHP